VVFGLACGACIVFQGATTALKRSVVFHNHWEGHRQVIAQVIHLAPQLQPDTLVVLVQMPKSADPIGHNLWFDFALRLSYPRTAVTGVYFYEDGTPAPGNFMQLQGDRWVWDRMGPCPPLLREVSIRNTIVIASDPTGRLTILDQLPPSFKVDTGVAELYHPYHQIRTGPPAAQARRRYLRRGEVVPSRDLDGASSHENTVKS